MSLRENMYFHHYIEIIISHIHVPCRFLDFNTCTCEFITGTVLVRCISDMPRSMGRNL